MKLIKDLKIVSQHSLSQDTKFDNGFKLKGTPKFSDRSGKLKMESCFVNAQCFVNSCIYVSCLFVLFNVI